jgi:uncharacterized membrane protein YheB (UPF0754 family)
MDEIGESSQEASSTSGTTALHVEDSSSIDNEPHRSLASDRESLQQQLDDLIDEQCQSIQDELQRQIDKEIDNALQKQIDDALQKQIDDAIQKQLDESLNEDFNRALDLHNRELSLATQRGFPVDTSIYDDDESVGKLLQEYLNPQK